MPLEVKVTLHCAECGKKVPIKGKPFTHHSRRHGSSSGIYLPDVYVIESPDEYNDYNKMEVSRGYYYLGAESFPEDDPGLVCSLDCAVRRVTKAINKLRPEKIEKEED